MHFHILWTIKVIIIILLFVLAGKDDIFGENPDGATGGWTSVNKSNYCVRALSYCDLHKVMVSDLQGILSLYPEFAIGFLQHFQVTFNLRLVSACT